MDEDGQLVEDADFDKDEALASLQEFQQSMEGVISQFSAVCGVLRICVKSFACTCML